MSTSETTTATGPLPAAWYRDPSGRYERRWWDGDAWTDRVADGDDVASDPPVRHQPVVPELTSGADSDVIDAESSVLVPVETEAATDPEPYVPLGQARSGPRPPEERASTGVAPRETHGRGVLAVGIVGIVAATASLLWGVQNHRTASQWQDRGEALQEELVTRASNTDALEEALSQSASRSARAQDGQQSFAQLHDAAVATVDQIRACALDLNHVFIALQLGDDPTIPVDQANRSCEQASISGETLIQVLDEVTGS
ncbi:MAG TPA: DUF2510 domain-containing protein [Acidimicrobiales bacterium]